LSVKKKSGKKTEKKADLEGKELIGIRKKVTVQKRGKKTSTPTGVKGEWQNTSMIGGNQEGRNPQDGSFGLKFTKFPQGKKRAGKKEAKGVSPFEGVEKKGLGY